MLGFVEKEAKKKNRAGLVGRTQTSVGMAASRRAVNPRGEVAAVSFLFVVAAIEGAMRLAEGEVMLEKPCW